MKKTILLLLAVAVAGVTTVSAQGGGGGFQRRTVEERVKMAMDKIADFKLDKAKSDQADSAFTNYYRSMDKARQDMMASGETDRQKMRENMMATMQKLNGERDDKLKTIFTDDQFKKWKDEIEPSLRPQRRQGGPGGGGGGGNQ